MDAVCTKRYTLMNCRQLIIWSWLARHWGLLAFLENHLPAKLDERTIEVLVDNRFQEKELLKMDLLSFLRKELNNNEIRFKIDLKPETEFKKYQTPQEIYKRMATDFPVLEKLRKKLDMEID